MLSLLLQLDVLKLQILQFRLQVLMVFSLSFLERLLKGFVVFRFALVVFQNF
jgi:hypothetical protein